MTGSERTYLISNVTLIGKLDFTATVVISSSTVKTATIFDAASEKPLVKCCSSEITTAMSLSTNAKQLITASDKGVIYIWRQPVDLTAKLVVAKTTPRVSACLNKELSDQISNVAN
jgi:WD40 repeat protein